MGGGLATKKKCRIVVVGLDNSGKTTVLNSLKPKKASLETVPTVGFATEEFQKHGVNFCAFDMSGQSRYRNLWEHYYDDIEQMIENEAVSKRRLPVLFLSNKMDADGACAPEEITKQLDIERIMSGPGLPWA